jgi:hypothetical protein
MNAMTEAMIEWTLELLDWIRDQLPREWPDVEMRGNHPELTSEGYCIRFRHSNRQFWLCCSPAVMAALPVSEVEHLLTTRDWISLLRETGMLRVDVMPQDPFHPILNLVPTMEVKSEDC